MVAEADLCDDDIYDFVIVGGGSAGAGSQSGAASQSGNRCPICESRSSTAAAIASAAAACGCSAARPGPINAEGWRRVFCGAANGRAELLWRASCAM